MGKTLAIDTSSYVMGIAVTDGTEILGEMTTNLKKNHSLRLVPAINMLLKEVDTKPAELERIVVAHGPGSYTGVRIGVTTAKAMAWSLHIPLVGVSSLEMQAYAGRYFLGYICPLIDARRGQVYTGLYQNEQGLIACQSADRITLLSDWLAQLAVTKKQVLFIGQDVSLHQEKIKEVLQEKAVFAAAASNLPRPGELAVAGLIKKADASIHSFVPQYLQLAEAEAKWKKAQENKE